MIQSTAWKHVTALECLIWAFDNPEEKYLQKYADTGEWLCYYSNGSFYRQTRIGAIPDAPPLDYARQLYFIPEVTK